MQEEGEVKQEGPEPQVPQNLPTNDIEGLPSEWQNNDENASAMQKQVPQNNAAPQAEQPEVHTYSEKRIEEASRWGSRRRVIVISIFIALLLVLAGLVTYPFISQEPSCFDGKQNGAERGVDCGGSCSRVCKADVAMPRLLWTQAFHVNNGVYSAVAYFDNPSEALTSSEPLTYRFVFYNDAGEEIAEKEGEMEVPRRANFAIFEGRLNLPQEPARTILEYTEPSTWNKASVPARAVIAESEILRNEATLPEVEAVLYNTTLEEKRNVRAVAIIFDSKQNAVAASQTEVPLLPADSYEAVRFTWPTPLQFEERECRVPVDVSLVLDRSGSMNDDGNEPPEPLTSVKDAALIFSQSFREGDKVSVVSFANEATIHAELQEPKETTQEAIRNIEIVGVENEQHTNITAGLQAAGESLHNNTSETARKVVVLLTDGIASRPLGPDGDEDAFPRDAALEEAVRLRSEGVELYTIGLGDGADLELLEAMTDQNRSYFSPEKEDLQDIYAEIAKSLCVDGGYYTEVIPVTN